MMAAEECVSVHVWFREETDIGDALVWTAEDGFLPD